MKAGAYLAWMAAVALPLMSQAAIAAGEIALSDFSGEKVAYIAGDKAIYLWDGRPVAYLIADREGGEDVFGFNGRHLGWFLEDMIWNHDGRPVCTTKESKVHALTPLKAAKAAEPARAAREAVPVRPIFVKAYEDTACRVFLSQGG